MSDQGESNKREGRKLHEQNEKRDRSRSRSSTSSSGSEKKDGTKSVIEESRDQNRQKDNSKSTSEEQQTNKGRNPHRVSGGSSEDSKQQKSPKSNGQARYKSAYGGSRVKNTSNSSSSGYGSSNNNQRPKTSHARLESTSTPRGYDNSEKNPNRLNLGSSTDRVASERPIFGAWRAPDPERQRHLVDRLAPARPPPQPDPKFNHWRNHFLYYWQIGVDQKPRRQGNYGDSPRVGSSDSENRLLKRPRTTSSRTMLDNTNNINNDYNANPLIGSASVGRRQTIPTRGSQSARDSYGESGNSGVVAGLDRRYMGLQAVSGPEMNQIVDRLTKLTSAYNAKFAPNPHVWVDTEPGAHMVKRTNTTIG